MYHSSAFNAVTDHRREMDAAAIKIQSRYRGHTLRKSRKEEYDAASKLQVRALRPHRHKNNALRAARAPSTSNVINKNK